MSWYVEVNMSLVVWGCGWRLWSVSSAGSLMGRGLGEGVEAEDVVVGKAGPRGGGPAQLSRCLVLPREARTRSELLRRHYLTVTRDRLRGVMNYYRVS